MKENNTEYVLSLSYGKDSMASIHVIKDILHLPLTRIIHAEVWATDTIPADLPPMVDFKAKADKIIKERWGIDVEHVCAMKKPGSCYGVFGRPCEGGRNSHTTICYTPDSKTESTSVVSKDSLRNSGNGANGSNLIIDPKLTYENIFYRPIKSSRSKIVHAERERDGQPSGVDTAHWNSKNRLYGFPISPSGMWCQTNLKLDPLRISPTIQGKLVQQPTQSRPLTGARTMRVI